MKQLRPFDPTTHTEDMCYVTNSGKTLRLLGGPNAYGNYAFQCDEDKDFLILNPVVVYLKPLGYVENQPVYEGDVLYWNDNSTRPGLEKHIRRVNDKGRFLGITTKGGELLYSGGDISAECLTWTKPKTKVKKEGWINIYPNSYATGELMTSQIIEPTKEAALKGKYPNAVDTIRIEWEEESFP